VKTHGIKTNKIQYHREKEIRGPRLYEDKSRLDEEEDCIIGELNKKLNQVFCKKKQCSFNGLGPFKFNDMPN
jgi:hypothetical protein